MYGKWIFFLETVTSHQHSKLFEFILDKVLNASVCVRPWVVFFHDSLCSNGKGYKNTHSKEPPRKKKRNKTIEYRGLSNEKCTEFYLLLCFIRCSCCFHLSLSPPYLFGARTNQYLKTETVWLTFNEHSLIQRLAFHCILVPCGIIHAHMLNEFHSIYLRYTRKKRRKNRTALNQGMTASTKVSFQCYQNELRTGTHTLNP